MRITYLAHSGFIVTTSEVVMVFDYYRDPAHALHKVLDEHPGLPVVFFVSHSHPDHYNPEIFNLAQNHKRVYILSNDVEARDTDSRLAIQGMSPGDRVDDILGGLTVQAYDSTDAGVSFVVTTREGKTICHAGDLNNWHWNEESSPREVAEADAAFRKALGRIASEHSSLDVAFFPVDVRQGRDFAVGATEFVEAIRVADFFPMHFDGNYMVACDFGVYPFHTKVDTTFHCLHEPGESIALD